MIKIFLPLLLLCSQLSLAQSLPIDFENNIVTADFVDFDGGTATVLPNTQSSGINTSATVAQIVRNGGAQWSGSKIYLASNLDFSSSNIITMKVYTSAPVGTVVKFKLEGSGSTERDASAVALAITSPTRGVLQYMSQFCGVDKKHEFHI